LIQDGVKKYPKWENRKAMFFMIPGCGKDPRTLPREGVQLVFQLYSLKLHQINDVMGADMRSPWVQLCITSLENQ